MQSQHGSLSLLPSGPRLLMLLPLRVEKKKKKMKEQW